MWSPTHVQVLVKRAKGLNIKGKNGTNDPFVMISLGKEKFQTSVKEKAGQLVDWAEQCELSIPSQGNTAEVTLTVLHRNFLGVDEFLGQAVLPLREFDVYERPRSRWLSLKCKPGKNKTEYRGELEVKLGFTVKASTDSTTDLAKKNRGSVQSITKAVGNIGGSLMSIGSKEKKNIKSLAKSVKEKVKDKSKKNSSSLKLNKESKGLRVVQESDQRGGDESNEDPGVNSDNEEDEEFKFETISQPSPAPSSSRAETESRRSTESGSGQTRPNPPSSLSVSRTSSGRSRIEENQEWDAKLRGRRAMEQAKESGKTAGKVKGSLSSLPSYNEATEESVKKKIIPVQSDFESSPSPENPSSPLSSPPPYHKNRFRMSQSTLNLARHDNELKRKKESLGLKLKTSYSFVRERPDAPIPDFRRNSIESEASRTYSDTSMGPPNGARVVVGRETSPSPDLATRLPHDVLSRFNGKTREDLIELVVGLQGQVDHQGRKIGDLEDYIDNMLIRILEVAPILLKKPSPVLSKGRQI